MEEVLVWVTEGTNGDFRQITGLVDGTGIIDYKWSMSGATRHCFYTDTPEDADEHLRITAETTDIYSHLQRIIVPPTLLRLPPPGVEKGTRWTNYELGSWVLHELVPVLENRTGLVLS